MNNSVTRKEKIKVKINFLASHPQNSSSFSSYYLYKFSISLALSAFGTLENGNRKRCRELWLISFICACTSPFVNKPFMRECFFVFFFFFYPKCQCCRSSTFSCYGGWSTKLSMIRRRRIIGILSLAKCRTIVFLTAHACQKL